MKINKDNCIAFLRLNVHTIFFGVLAIIFCVISISTTLNESPTGDEIVHVSSGYVHLTKQDYRFNLEKPPIFKVLATVPLLFMHINLPQDISVWDDGLFDTGNFAHEFWFTSGNNPDTLLLLSRIPMVLLTLCLGLFLFRWVIKMGGNFAGIVFSVLFWGSTLILAHGKIVHNDIAGVLGFVISLYTFINLLSKPTIKNGIWFGLAFGLSLLFKQSVVIILFPFEIILFVYWRIFKVLLRHYLYPLMISGLVCVSVVGIVYGIFTSGYPVNESIVHANLMQQLDGTKVPWLDSEAWLTNPILRPYYTFILGTLMTFRRAAYVGPIYFLGNIQLSGSWNYFPILLITKIPLTLIAGIIILGGLCLHRFIQGSKSNIMILIKTHFSQMAILFTAIFYLLIAVIEGLNIGVRHVLPVYVFGLLLIAWITSRVVRWTKHRKIFLILIGIMLTIYYLPVFFDYPNYLSSYNQLAGGIDNGYKIAVDSNYEWGSDLKMLASWAETNSVKSIYVDCVIGCWQADQYYLIDKYLPPSRTFSLVDNQDEGTYLAVCVTRLFSPVVSKNDIDYYMKYPQLQSVTPLFRVGKGVFIYKIKEIQSD